MAGRSFFNLLRVPDGGKAFSDPGNNHADGDDPWGGDSRKHRQPQCSLSGGNRDLDSFTGSIVFSRISAFFFIGIGNSLF